jgi:hypothetical protein
MLKKLIKIKSSYDSSQGKRKEDIKHNVSELRKLWDKHRPEYILMIKPVGLAHSAWNCRKDGTR